MKSDYIEPLYFEMISGVHMQDRRLLTQAFTHRSYLNEINDTQAEDNERLEFLGDAVLSFVVSKHLFDRFPHHSEGDLTRLRSLLVRRETLAKAADRYRLGEYLWLGKGEEESGGRSRTATLCATFEAVVGAVYQEQGIEATKQFVLTALENEIAGSTDGFVDKDPKSRLQEYVQSVFNITPRYRTLSASGPDHAKLFVVGVKIAKLLAGVGQGYSKQEAAQLAAAMTLQRLGLPAPEYNPDETLETAMSVVPIEEILAQKPPE